MNEKFDELAKGLAQSGTRRQALKKFGVGLAGVALACFGLTSVAKADKKCLPRGTHVTHLNECRRCCSGGCSYYSGSCPTCSFRYCT
jgi:hypothetical protein